jgi:CMP-N-acetylneuraminic acid synthetase
MDKIVTIIPARMGSERVKRKNLREIAGKNLIQHAIDCAKASEVTGHIIVTSDDSSVFNEISGQDSFIVQPSHLSTSTADIRHVVQWVMGRLVRDWTHVVTLQPAVLARSPSIMADLVRHVVENETNGGLTMARSHPWVWHQRRGGLDCGWDYNDYPRSQTMGRVMCEINAVQVTPRWCVGGGKRWWLPLSILELPTWSQALDIDTEEDMAHAEILGPAMLQMLEGWRGRITTHAEII